MNINDFKKFIDKLKDQGMEIENLKLIQVFESIQLYEIMQSYKR